MRGPLLHALSRVSVSDWHPSNVRVSARHHQHRQHASSRVRFCMYENKLSKPINRCCVLMRIQLRFLELIISFSISLRILLFQLCCILQNQCTHCARELWPRAQSRSPCLVLADAVRGLLLRWIPGHLRTRDDRGGWHHKGRAWSPVRREVCSSTHTRGAARAAGRAPPSRQARP